ncbi:peptidoglycan DD-metalloendopeptidase family protein [bacterium]|nr:peptidoglycan DD-metalloendopeptidase family protein [bacterium]
MDSKKLQRIICAGFLSGALILNGVASAAVVTNRLPLLGYADHNIVVYRAPGGVKAAMVPAVTALIQITQVRVDGWAYGTYPLSNGRRANGWFRMSDIQNNVNYSNVAGTIISQQPVYRTPNQNGLNGNVPMGTSVLVIAEQGSLSQIIYKQPNSMNWRIGWVMTSAVKKTQPNVVTGNTVAKTTTKTVNSSVNKTPATANTTVNKTAQPVNSSVNRSSVNKTSLVSQTTNTGTTAQKTVQQQTSTSTNTSSSTQTPQIKLDNSNNIGLQLGRSTTRLVNRFGQTLRQIPTYNYANLTNSQGVTLGTGVAVIVLEETDASYKITFSANNRLMDGWVAKSNISLLNVTYKSWQGKMNRKANVYYNVELNNPKNPFEYADANDNVTVIDEKGNAYLIIYELLNGSYKARWVDKNALAGTNPNRVAVPIIKEDTNPIIKQVERIEKPSIKGDVNKDGVVDIIDLSILVKYLNSGNNNNSTYNQLGDLNNDGSFDIVDVSRMTMMLTGKMKGDVNGDGKVDNADVELIKNHIFNKTYDPRADINDDGKISGTDLSQIAVISETTDAMVHGLDALYNIFKYPLHDGSVKLTTLYKYSSGEPHNCQYYAGGDYYAKWDKTIRNSTKAYGIDISEVSGVPVYAVGHGTVIFSGWDPNDPNQNNGKSFGNLIKIDHGNNRISLYAHLKVRSVNVGDSVNANTKIGEVGNTGGNYGSHLHFEMSWQDPYEFFTNQGINFNVVAKYKTWP